MDLFSYLLGRQSTGGGGEGQTIQYDVIPTPSIDYLGQIIQYVGSTDATYTQGYFYICVSDNESTPTYSWVNINVQDVSGLTEAEVMKKIRDAGVVELTSEMITSIIAKYESSKLTPAMLYLEYGNAIFKFDADTDMYISTASSNKKTFYANSYGVMVCDGQIFLVFNSGQYGNNTAYVYYQYAPTTVSVTYSVTVISGYNTNLTTGLAYILQGKYLTDDTNQNVTGKKTFYTLPEASISPTSNDQFTNKTYVDSVANPIVTTSSASTYTIASLVGNQVYKLGEITSLTITAVTTFDKDTVIYFDSGSTATSISIPDTLTNIGDVPTLTTASNVSTGTCEASKSYIIAVLNNIAVWKAY